MPSLAELPELTGFFSYSREDDDDFKGALSALRDRIRRSLRSQLGITGAGFRLFQDTEAISHGAQWEKEIKGAIAKSVFFIPIVTPTAVNSRHCKTEFELFREREAELGREDLIFPILYIRVPALNSEAKRSGNNVLEIIHARQHADWTRLRQHDVASLEFGQKIEDFCQDIVEALSKPWQSPEERRRQAENEQRRSEEAETRRRAEQEEQHRAAEAEATRVAEEERRRQAENEQQRSEAETRRQAEQEEQHRAAEAEAMRVAEEEHRRREEDQRGRRDGATDIQTTRAQKPMSDAKLVREVIDLQPVEKTQAKQTDAFSFANILKLLPSWLLTPVALMFSFLCAISALVAFAFIIAGIAAPQDRGIALAIGISFIALTYGLFVFSKYLFRYQDKRLL
jgi:hypothetical protein